MGHGPVNYIIGSGPKSVSLDLTDLVGFVETWNFPATSKSELSLVLSRSVVDPE